MPVKKQFISRETPKIEDASYSTMSDTHASQKRIYSQRNTLERISIIMKHVMLAGDVVRILEKYFSPGLCPLPPQLRSIWRFYDLLLRTW